MILKFIIDYSTTPMVRRDTLRYGVDEINVERLSTIQGAWQCRITYFIEPRWGDLGHRVQIREMGSPQPYQVMAEKMLCCNV